MSLAYHDFDTPIGTLRVVGDDGGIERIDLPNAAASDPYPEWRERHRSLPGPLREAKRQLIEYFGGELPVKETLLAHEQGVAGGGALNGRHARKPQAEGMGQFPGRKPPIQTRAATPR